MRDEIKDKIIELFVRGFPVALTDEAFMLTLFRIIDWEIEQQQDALRCFLQQDKAIDVLLAVRCERERWLMQTANRSEN
jgi:hypothetical protein